MSTETSTGNGVTHNEGGGEENGESKAVTNSNDASGFLINGSGLSKNALKKLKNRERWLEHRKRKRIEEKQRRKEKRVALKEAGLGEALKRFRGKTMEQSTCKVRVAIDMSFDHLMSEKDCRRAVQQLNWSYSANRRLPEPLQFYIVSFAGPSRKIYDSIESNQNQDIFLKTESINDLFKPSEIVYLTADSDNVLTELDDSKVYVIGGLVDHNSQKGLCLEHAVKFGYGHARLPIDEFVQMKTRKVLTINHVFEILAHFSDHGDWEKAFFTVIPPRKGMAKKTEAEGSKDSTGDGCRQYSNEVDGEEDSDSPPAKRSHEQVEQSEIS
ncbi:RNA (Guanine-9-)-methyltransferase domain-containing protein 2 [Trichostrongylus colubriformis]|uniref:tRNA (guanine(9)-N(1))-methyltransferase n=1 Tax=Trichostrongylus colubriformis TaxID=6319 RepID=A0AAN8G2Y4_TRICO